MMKFIIAVLAVACCLAAANADDCSPSKGPFKWNVGSQTCTDKDDGAEPSKCCLSCGSTQGPYTWKDDQCRDATNFPTAPACCTPCGTTEPATYHSGDMRCAESRDSSRALPFSCCFQGDLHVTWEPLTSCGGVSCFRYGHAIIPGKAEGEFALVGGWGDGYLSTYSYSLFINLTANSFSDYSQPAYVVVPRGGSYSEFDSFVVGYGGVTPPAGTTFRNATVRGTWQGSPRRLLFDTVSTFGDHPEPRCGQASSAYSSFMFVFGGMTSIGATVKRSNDMYLLDTGSMNWYKVTVFGDQPSPRSNVTSFGYDGKWYIYGGIDQEGRILNDLYQFDMNTRYWKRISTSSDSPRRAGAATILFKDHLIFFGGLDENNVATQDLFALGLSSGFTFRKFAPSGLRGIPPVRFLAAAAVKGDYVYLYGGTPNGRVAMNDMWRAKLINL